MKRYPPLVMSILANLGGGAAVVGIAYLLDPILPAFGGETRQRDRDFLQPLLLGWAMPSILFPLCFGSFQLYRHFGSARDEKA